MEHRRQPGAGSIALVWLVVSFLAGQLEAGESDRHPFEVGVHATLGPQQLCQELCGECRCNGQLVGETMCQCNCEFPSESAGESNCTLKMNRLCRQMDVECDFSRPEISYTREPRGHKCHSMSCYEKHHHGHEGGHEGYYGEGEEDGYGEGHGMKELICCKDKKHKEKHKHKHKKHKKDKHRKFHIVIKGKMPEPSCHHEGSDYGYSEGYEHHDEYRAAGQSPHPTFGGPSMPMDVSVWANGKNLKKPPQKKPPSHQQHADSGPRGKSAEPQGQPSHDSPPPPPPPPPPEPESPPERPLTPPPNLFDGAPIPPPRSRPQEPPKTHHNSQHPSDHEAPRPPSFTRPAPPPPMDLPSRRMEAPRSSAPAPSYSNCQFDSYDFNYYYHPPLVSAPHPPPPPPPPPPPVYYRSSAPSYTASHSSSYYQPRDQYTTYEHYSEYEQSARNGEYDDDHDSSEFHHHPYQHHGVHPLADSDPEDWPPPLPHPADLLTFNQIVSRQIWENERARLYRTDPFQPTPRPWRDEFEPSDAEVAPVQYEAAASDSSEWKGYEEKKNEWPKPPLDAFIPPVPPPVEPVDFPTAEHRPMLYPSNSEEAQYRQPTPPPHYLRRKGAGQMASYGFEQPTPSWGHRQPGFSSAYGRSQGSFK